MTSGEDHPTNPDLHLVTQARRTLLDEADHLPVLPLRGRTMVYGAIIEVMRSIKAKNDTKNSRDSLDGNQS